MRKTIARAAFAASVLILLSAVHSGAQAQGRYGGYPPKYCVRAYDGASECFYFDLQQCLAAVRGTGGDCAINPRFAGYPNSAGPRWKRVYR